MLTEGGWAKTTSDKTFHGQKALDKTLGQKPPRTKTYVYIHVLLKIGGSRDV